MSEGGLDDLNVEEGPNVEEGKDVVKGPDVVEGPDVEDSSAKSQDLLVQS